MFRPFLPLFVAVLLVHLCSTVPTAWSSSTTAAAEVTMPRPLLHLQGGHAVVAKAAAAGCGGAAAAASRVESCTGDVVRSFFGVRGSELCCHALKTVGAACYRAMFSGSPLADLYPTIVGNVCGLGGAPSPAA